ncbi:hypothetical protein C4571_01910 [Candidatus Parcubacteria bacterium]|nr:MAG: hypothetical protein C4571_01910 [Candidatus Parcubacteria bacterium]
MENLDWIESAWEVWIPWVLLVLGVVFRIFGNPKLVRLVRTLRFTVIEHKSLVHQLTEAIEDYSKTDTAIKRTVAARIPDHTPEGRLLNDTLEKTGKRKPRQNFGPRKRPAAGRASKRRIDRGGP